MFTGVLEGLVHIKFQYEVRARVRRKPAYGKTRTVYGRVFFLALTPVNYYSCRSKAKEEKRAGRLNYQQVQLRRLYTELDSVRRLSRTKGKIST